MASLDDALCLAPAGEGEWRGFADPAFEANTGMFGGWTAALLLKSVLSDQRAVGAPISLSVNYVRRIAPGGEVCVRARRCGGSRSVTTWMAEISIDDDIMAAATIVLGVRRASDGFTECIMPAAADPKSVPMFHPPDAFGKGKDVRPTLNHPPFNRDNSRSLDWGRMLSGRPLDYLQLALICDAMAPRIFYRSSGPRLSSTLTLSAYFFATPRELAAVGGDYTLTEAFGTRAESSIVGAGVRIWSKQGDLLATSEQLCWFT